MERVEYVDRVKHVWSEYRTNDEELAFALGIEEEAECVNVTAKDDKTDITVFTTKAVYHFSTFRADYIGHASRTLVELLRHFNINLPIEFVVSHQTFQVYLTGEKVVAGDHEYPIAYRSEGYELVESVEWMIASSVLDVVLRLAEEFEVTPEQIVETTVGSFYSLLSIAEEFEVDPETIISTLTETMKQQWLLASPPAE
ncbi:hypothetical protein C7445_1309 [Alicyclobacillus sacchari]|uniref:Uncharacterized protein n=1 Tax=Alicyclobacillus sacchari TaxID=392010 RepID=A0A4R8L7Z3_9BACL|nr:MULTISPECIES: hypothetical protein [Alicyclobacillus]EJY57309.1 hypothetical protein URH17368_0032 [Alicyclobacillus hesperidum URH17-3-68]TDY38876.1 hypothetical protein C7445_1309 [Alicyclobacillus sacchari]GMA59296.1 hypothetical protein GCM10025858_37990 [Alicyclobacillus sacchari]